jgi:hypothetical protein
MSSPVLHTGQIWCLTRTLSGKLIFPGSSKQTFPFTPCNCNFLITFTFLKYDPVFIDRTAYKMIHY